MRKYSLYIPYFFAYKAQHFFNTPRFTNFFTDFEKKPTVLQSKYHETVNALTAVEGMKAQQ